MLALLLPIPATAQLWLDAIASTARPPASVPGAGAAAYGLLGGRLHFVPRGLLLDGAAYFGSGARGEDGRWLTGTASIGRSWSAKTVTATASIDGSTVRYLEPFDYALGWATLRGTAARSFGRTEIGAVVEASRGRWSTEYTAGSVLLPVARDTSGPLRLDVVSAVLRQAIGAGVGTALVRLARTPSAHIEAVVQLTYPVRGFEWTLHAAALNGPNAANAGAGLRLSRTFGKRLRVSAELERQVSDLLLGTPPNTGGSFGLSWMAADPFAPSAAAQLVHVRSRSTRGAQVDFRLKLDQAASVALVGSFTNWEPLAMSRQGGLWLVSMQLPPGSHQFAFLVDGEWFVPENASGLIDDGFGRKNATVVIEPM